MLAIVRPPTATVHVVAESECLVRQITELLADECTCVVHQRPRATVGASVRSVGWPDVIVIDSRLPVDIAAYIRRSRQRWQTVDIVVVNVTSNEQACSLLDIGADDIALCDSILLSARLHASVRRARSLNAQIRIAIGDIVFDREARRTWCAGKEVALTPRECTLLDCLFAHAPHPVSLEAVSERVWGKPSSRTNRAVVDVYIGYLRRKLKSSRTVRIQTIRNIGYAFVPAQETSVHGTLAPKKSLRSNLRPPESSAML